MDKRLTALLLMFFLSFSVFTAVVVFGKQISSFTRASGEMAVSAKTAVILAWPLNLAADGKTRSQINVFVRNEKEQPIKNKVVTLTTNLGQIIENEVATDADGKAIFNIVSTDKGIATVSAVVDGVIKLDAKVTIQFN